MSCEYVYIDMFINVIRELSVIRVQIVDANIIVSISMTCLIDVQKKCIMFARINVK